MCDLSPLVPSLPSLSGMVAHLQAAAIDFALAEPIELTNALAVTLGEWSEYSVEREVVRWR